MYFAKIESVGNLFETIMIDEDRGELYVQTRNIDGVEEMPDELLVNKDGYEEVYGIDPLGDLCQLRTWKYAIRYFYEKEFWEGMKFSDCTIMEYTSDTLTSFLCTYPDDEEDRDSLIDVGFDVEDVQFRFCGHRLHIEQRNPEYETVKQYVGNLKDKIMSHGRERGHKEKLRKAIEEIYALIPKRINAYEHNFNLNETVKRIYRLRTNIVHNGNLIRFEREECFAGEELQWVAYALQLRQIGIPDNKLEKWLDRAFGVG